ncbi:MAG: hypothetical protein K0Q91_2136 [Fibrobacteria bacterium]|jgi:hypothetical protein|nr:hypothetical protein [Fibrobacteria bacterium]
MKKALLLATFAFALGFGYAANTPAPAENCCKKMCDRGGDKEKACCKKHQDDKECCKKESCDKK